MTAPARGGSTPESAAVETDYAIPERSGETLIVPPPERLPALLTVFDPGTGRAVLGVPLRDFRRRTRERVAGLVGAPGADRPIVLMGHQPVFFHPGVWVKYFLLSKLCGINGAAGIHCIVDSDATGAISAAIPTGRDGVGRATRTLVPLADDVPLEAAAVPSPDAWAAFAAAVRGDLETLRMPDLLDRFGAFAAAEPAVRREAATLAAYLDGLRRAYEARAGRPAAGNHEIAAGAPRYLDVSVSALASTPEFQAFALHLVQDPRALRDAYNGCLDDYRRAHRVRSAANPFPNLAEAGGRTETPFWILHGGRRTDLYASREGNRLVLGSAERSLATIPAGPGGVETLAGAGVALRPKALTLTLFARLCLGDLFIHGVGGGRYDRVTEPLAQRLFDARPAPYAVATATLHLPLAGDRDPARERHTLERRLMDLRHNPDRHLDAAGEAERRLVDEKWRLIREVETMRPGRERRAATQRIREVNTLLAKTLAPEIARVEAQLAALNAQPPAEDVIEFRGYPFFLFDPNEVAALVPDLGRS
ncbi:MAG: hypothetical protein ACYDAB_13790 [bacterium]